MIICLSRFLFLSLCLSQVFLELMDLEEAPDSEGSEKSELFSQKEEEEFDEGEEEEDEEQNEEEEEEEKGEEKVKTGLLNPLLQPILTGDVDSLQKIFEDPENPLYDQAEHLLLEEDIVRRNLLYAACMAGQSEVIRVLAKYGVNLNDNTARGILPLFIYLISSVLLMTT